MIAATGRAWPCPSSKNAKPPGPSAAINYRRQGTVGFETVGAAIERRAGIETRHFRLETVDLAGRYIGRVGQDDIGRAQIFFAPIAQDEFGTRGQAQFFGVAPRGRYRARQNVDADAGGVGKFGEKGQQQRAAAGAEIDRAQGSIAAGNMIQRRFDQGFAIRARIERVGREIEIETPEFALAANAGIRLVGGIGGGRNPRSGPDRPGPVPAAAWPRAPGCRSRRVSAPARRRPTTSFLTAALIRPRPAWRRGPRPEARR